MNSPHDVIEHKQAEEEVIRLSSAVRMSTDSIVLTDLEGKIAEVNEATLRMYGTDDKGDLIGKNVYDFVAPEDREKALADRQEVLEKGYIKSREHCVITKSGSKIPVEMSVAVIKDAEGKPIGFVGMSRDISVRKELEQQQADFLAMLTHDIRNPLGVILGYVWMLQEMGGLSPEQEDIVRRMGISTQVVLSLVNNYLDFSKIEAGRLTLVRKLLGLNELLSRVGQQYEAEARCRQITLEFHLQEELLLVEGDSLALERVFANLLHNALKFTPELGKVTVSTKRQNNAVVVMVADTGPGIVPEEVPFIFEKYRRAASAQHQEGVGLGLFIIKVLVEAHGGRIEVESTLGQGSCFSVFLPIVPASQV